MPYQGETKMGKQINVRQFVELEKGQRQRERGGARKGKCREPNGENLLHDSGTYTWIKQHGTTHTHATYK